MNKHVEEMTDIEQRKCYKIFLLFGNKDSFEGFKKQYANDTFTSLIGNLIDYYHGTVRLPGMIAPVRVGTFSTT